MEKFIEPYFNFSLSALVRIDGNSSGMYSSLPRLSPTITPTAQPFYYTTLASNSISLIDDDYAIRARDEMGTTTTTSVIISDIAGDNNGGGSSLEENHHDLIFNESGVLTISDLPEEYRVVDETAWPRIYAYLAVFIVSAIANFCELVWVCRRLKTRASPVNRLFLHLCIADLIVVFGVAAVEVFWRISIGWYAGNFMCKAVMFSRAFGLYLSSLMIICISLDRYYAVVHPLRVIDASRRVKIMLSSAWITAAVCAVPQSIVFREETHPHFPIFHQCSTLWQPKLERVNSWLSMTMMYFIPLGVIIFSYGSIIIKIASHLHGETRDNGSGTIFLRRNGIPIFQRAKLRTLKLTTMIVLAFVLCWTPYILISTWYLIDEKSATELDGNIQDALFIMAVANSMTNPLVYGFNESCKKRKAQNQDTVKNQEPRSDALTMRNYNSCKLIQYFRAFGLYLSSLMLICLSLDRFYAVVYPLRVVDASRRIKIMLTIAWTTAAVCAAPQCIVFQVQSHPEFPAFKQCNSVLSGVLAEAINTAISTSFMYFLPILVIIFSYGNIIVKLAREADGPDEGENSNRFLRRSGASVMDRAKIKTLKLSFVIVMVFVFCWTPYVVISIWHIVDRESAENLNPYIQEALFIMVVANSSVNPLVYGIFNTKKANHNTYQRTQSIVSRNTMNESKRRVVIARNRASVMAANADLLSKKPCSAPDGSPSASEISPLNSQHDRNKVTQLHITQ